MLQSCFTLPLKAFLFCFSLVLNHLLPIPSQPSCSILSLQYPQQRATLHCSGATQGYELGSRVRKWMSPEAIGGEESADSLIEVDNKVGRVQSRKHPSAHRQRHLGPSFMLKSTSMTISLYSGQNQPCTGVWYPGYVCGYSGPHINFGINLSISIKKSCGILIVIVLNL